MEDALFHHFDQLGIDYHSMERLVTPVISWQAINKCDPPRVYPSRYLVTFRIQAPTADGREPKEHVVEIDSSSTDYPKFAPAVWFRTREVIHPHVWSDGSRKICIGRRYLGESLADVCIRIARFLTYDPSVIRESDIASRDFYRWYLENKNRLPLENPPLPCVDAEDLDDFVVKRQVSGSSLRPGEGFEVKSFKKS